MIIINNKEIKINKFPNGELDINMNEIPPFELGKNYSYYTFDLIFDKNGINHDELFALMFIKKELDEIVFRMKAREYNIKVYLNIPFCPYGQMDRRIDGHLFSFKHFADFINNMNFDIVNIYDVHSPLVTNALIKNVEIDVFPSKDVNLEKYDLILYPDQGAAKKYTEYFPYSKYSNYIVGNKKRNLLTGEIIRYEILANKEDIEGKNVIIIDDLCMGGRTFKEAAKALREMGAFSVDLYITHLMPQAKEFYDNHKEFGIDNFFTNDTMNILK